MEGKKTGSDTRLMADENDPQQEPSMEDILASIRRILSEDEQEETSSNLADPGVDLAPTRRQRQNPYPGQKLNLYLSQAWQLLATKWRRREWKRNLSRQHQSPRLS